MGGGGWTKASERSTQDISMHINIFLWLQYLYSFLLTSVFPGKVHNTWLLRTGSSSLAFSTFWLDSGTAYLLNRDKRERVSCFPSTLADAGVRYLISWAAWADLVPTPVLSVVASFTGDRVALPLWPFLDISEVCWIGCCQDGAWRNRPFCDSKPRCSGWC